MPDENPQPTHKQFLQGRVVFCDEFAVRQYLKKLDPKKANALFYRAKNKGGADLVLRKGTQRLQYRVTYHAGSYTVARVVETDDAWE